MYMQNGQNPAGGLSISRAVSTTPCTSVRASYRPERHTRTTALRVPLHAQMQQNATQGYNLSSTRIHAASMEMTEPKDSPTKVEWYNKKKELWIEADNLESLKSLINDNETGKPIVVDFYAGWCSSCKTAYPALCKIAGDPNMRQKFEFAKVDIQRPGVMQFVRAFGVKGIPTVAVFDSRGEMLAFFGASFRKMSIVKTNLAVISANIESNFITDPNGFVMPKPE